MTRYGLAVDTKVCIGCHTCAVSCRNANNLPNNVWYCSVKTDGEGGMDCAVGSYPDCSVSYHPVSCMHCDNPKCVEVCPTGASMKREDGIVSVDSELCIGCKSCIAACPYSGVRTLLDDAPAYYADQELGSARAPKHIGGTVEKCNLCYKNLEAGEDPFCVWACPERCRIAGDLDDPNSQISKLVASRDYERLSEKEGTGPNIYYLK